MWSFESFETLSRHVCPLFYWQLCIMDIWFSQRNSPIMFWVTKGQLRQQMRKIQENCWVKFINSQKLRLFQFLPGKNVVILHWKTLVTGAGETYGRGNFSPFLICSPQRQVTPLFTFVFLWLLYREKLFLSVKFFKDTPILWPSASFACEKKKRSIFELQKWVLELLKRRSGQKATIFQRIRWCEFHNRACTPTRGNRASAYGPIKCFEICICMI